MNITKITDDYNKTITLNCTNNEDDGNIEIIIPLFAIVPCGISLILLISFMVFTLVKPLINKK